VSHSVPFRAYEKRMREAKSRSRGHLPQMSRPRGPGFPLMTIQKAIFTRTQLKDRKDHPSIVDGKGWETYVEKQRMSGTASVRGGYRNQPGNRKGEGDRAI